MRVRDDRHLKLAAQLSGLSEERATSLLTTKNIVLTWPGSAERTVAGRALVRTTANLIVRFAPKVRIARQSEFAKEVGNLIVRVDSSAQPNSTDFVDPVIVRLGGRPGKCHVSGSADGWTAFVSGRGEDLPTISDTGNVFGALAAAAFVASEVFRHALPVVGDFQWHAPLTRFSVFDYGPPVSQAPNVESPHLSSVPLMVGVGAIGQACVDALASLNACGAIRCVDKGYVDDETNLNRSVLAFEQDLVTAAPKVELAARRLDGSDLEVTVHLGELSSLLAKINQGDIPWPALVASALDNAEDRRLLQRLWPDTMLDAATGGSMVQVFRHVDGSELACLRCLHPDQASGRPYEETMADRTGLPAEQIMEYLSHPGVVLDAASLNQMKPEMRGFARQHLGSDVCGFLSAVETLYEAENTHPTLVSVSFSSYLAGVFLAAEIVKTELGIDTRLVSRYQIDPLLNLMPEEPFAQNRRSGCFCTIRARQISQFRSEMVSRK